MSEDTTLAALNPLLDDWSTDNALRKAFDTLRAHLEAMSDIELSARARPGVSWSLRAAAPQESERPLFAMVDVVDDDPTERWLSVCFYDDMITDADELGDWIPGGLFGNDARCFNIEEADDAFIAYVAERLSEACATALKK